MPGPPGKKAQGADETRRPPLRAHSKHEQEPHQNERQEQHAATGPMHSHHNGASPRSRGLERSQKQGYRGNQDHEDRVVNPFQQPHRRHRRERNSLLARNISGTDKFADPPQKEDRAETHHLANELDPEGSTLDRVKEGAPAKSANEVTRVNQRRRCRQIDKVGAFESAPEPLPAEIPPLLPPAEVESN